MPGFLHDFLSMFKQALISGVLAYGFMAHHSIAALMFRADRETGLLVWEHAALAILRVVMLVLSYCGNLRFMKGTIGLEEMNIVVCGAVVVSVLFTLAFFFPVEYVMIQFRMMQRNTEGIYPYSGYLDCALKTFEEGGILQFYAGFANHCSRIAPHLVMICMLFNMGRCYRSPIGWFKSLVQSIITMLKNFLLKLFYVILAISTGLAMLVWGKSISATIRPYFLWADLLFLEQASLALLRVEVHVLAYCGILRFLNGSIGQEEMDIVVGAITVVVSVVFAQAFIFPIEYVRIRRMQPNAYTGFFHCIAQTFLEGGVLNFYTGFTDHCSSIAPYLVMGAILMFFLEDECCSWSPSNVIKSIVKFTMLKYTYFAY